MEYEFKGRKPSAKQVKARLAEMIKSKGKKTMANQVTGKMLQAKVKSLNDWLGYSEGVWVKKDNAQVAVVGAYVLDSTYGGYRLCRITSEGGGEREITMINSAAVTMELISAYWQGMMEGGKMQAQA